MMAWVGFGVLRTSGDFRNAHWANKWRCARVYLVMVEFLFDRDSFRSLTVNIF